MLLQPRLRWHFPSKGLCNFPNKQCNKSNATRQMLQKKLFYIMLFQELGTFHPSHMTLHVQLIFHKGTVLLVQVLCKQTNSTGRTERHHHQRSCTSSETLEQVMYALSFVAVNVNTVMELAGQWHQPFSRNDKAWFSPIYPNCVLSRGLSEFYRIILYSILLNI